MTNVAYKRVSTVDQNLDRQFDDQDFDKVFSEKISGSTRNRPALSECLDYLREGDTLHVYSIDRLSRSIQDLIDIVSALNKKGVTLSFKKEGLTFTPDDTDPMAKFQLHLFGIIAEFERSIIRERQREGIEIAKRNGVYTDRNSRSIGEDKEGHITRLLLTTNFNAQEIADIVGVSRTTVFNRKRKLKNANDRRNSENKEQTQRGQDEHSKQ
jgi:DNA invertase Pin-like site-specific DNA recombinase